MKSIREQVDHFLQNKATEDMLENQLQSMTFGTPWAARSFGLTLAAAESGVFSLQEFQKSLIKVICDAENTDKPIVDDEDYYTCWLDAFTDLLKQKSSISSHSLATAEQFAYDRLLAIQHDHTHDHEECCKSKHFPEPITVERVNES